jgi:hypothetical protein
VVVQTFLSTYLPQVAITNQPYWTGLNDITTEGSPQWAGNPNVVYNQQTL